MDRPFVWIDDGITNIDRAWVSRNHSGPALLHAVDAGIGLTVGDVDGIATWLNVNGRATHRHA